MRPEDRGQRWTADIRFVVDSDGNVVMDKGEPRRVHPDIHRARTLIQWPYFKAQDEDSLVNEQLWAEQLRRDPDAQPSDKTHAPLCPRSYQMAAVAHIVARGYIWNDWCPRYWSTLLADCTGLGKTWIMPMVFTLLRYHRTRLADDNYRPPVTTEWSDIFYNYEESMLVDS